MPRHNVYFVLPWGELGKAGAKFPIYHNNKKVGTIEISKGKFIYRSSIPPRRKITKSWGQFDKFMKGRI